MKRQTSLLLTDRDFRNLDTLKKVYEMDANSAVISTILEEEAARINKYKNLNLKEE